MSAVMAQGTVRPYWAAQRAARSAALAVSQKRSTPQKPSHVQRKAGFFRARRMARRNQSPCQVATCPGAAV